MRIGIVTLWWSDDNYGQQLQCWALQQKLKELGHAPFLVRYRPIPQQSRYKCWIKHLPFYFSLKSLFLSKERKKKEALLENLRKKNQERHFAEFRNENIIVSDKEYYSLSELQQNPPEADCYITGSDQVWAYLLNTEENTAFYLNFGKHSIKRISYAPSFSYDEYPKDLKPQLAKQLKNFDAISVREINGVKICKEVGFEARQVLDPTLLLDCKSYHEIEEEIRTESPYIYIYSINIEEPGQIQWEQLKTFAKQKQYDVYVTPASGYFPGLELFDEVQYKYATIPQWLSYIKNAELVVTTSFHGVVFSIINHKNFVYFPLDGAYGRGNNRVLSLLEYLGLEKCIWKRNCSFPDCMNIYKDWDKVEALLYESKRRSAEFLQYNL